MTLPSPLVTSLNQQAGSSTTWTPAKISSASIVPVNSQTTTPGTSKLLKHRKCKEFLDAIMFYQLYAYLTSHLKSTVYIKADKEMVAKHRKMLRKSWSPGHWVGQTHERILHRDPQPPHYCNTYWPAGETGLPQRR
jgi:hypothetical protein